MMPRQPQPRRRKFPLPNTQEVSSNLEQLLESLIKMVGKANQKVDSLQKRVSQLESIVKEQAKERGPIIRYTTNPPTHTSSDTH
jgi:RNase adaptor protein for sRNA GlmZ degradation